MDRLPPNDTESEMAIIGCCVTQPVECVPQVQMVAISPDYFYDLRCRTAWEKILAMEISTVNSLTVRGEGVELDFLNSCVDLVMSVANLPAWLTVIEEKFIARRIIQTCTAGIAAAYEPGSALEFIERAVLQIRPNKIEQTDIKQLLRQATDIIEIKAQNWDSITGFSTGLDDLNKLTDGVHRGEFVVIAALPSCGKTALAVNIAVANALAGIPVGIFSAEMRPVQLVIRSLCSESRVNFKKVSKEDVPKFIVSTGKMSKSPIQFEAASGYTIGQIQAAARRMKQKRAIEILVVDYMQLITGVGDNREQQVASVSRGLKSISLELNICVLGLSQLNDEGRLRESRAIGQDADSVWMICNDGEWQPLVQPVKLKVQKSRDGETGEIPLTFLKTFTRFEQASKFSDVPNIQGED